MSSGRLIFCPCGSGKSTWIQKLSPDAKKVWLDGDQVLEDENVMNRNYFWYESRSQGISREPERRRIIDVFTRYLEAGFNILYSGNPLLMVPGLLIIPDPSIRRERLQRRGEYIPSESAFEEEERAYNLASERIPTIRGDIPDLTADLKRSK